jgi:adenylate cyclase
MARNELTGALIGAVVAAVIAASAGPLTSAEDRITDTWHTLAPPVPASGAVVVVAMDDESLTRLTEPLVFWGPHLATAIRAARDAGATVIGLDYTFETDAEDFLGAYCDGPIARTWDGPLREQLTQPDVIVSTTATTVGGQPKIKDLLPLHAALARPAIGRVAVANLSDRDGVLRGVFTAFGSAEVPRRLALSVLLAVHHLGLDPTAEAWTIGGRQVHVADPAIEIVWSGPTGTVPSVPFWRLVVPGALGPEDAALLDGSVVLMGAADTGSKDVFLTPHDNAFVGRPPRPIYGVEAHAQAVDALLAGARLYRAPWWAAAAALVALGLAVGGWFGRVRLRTASVTLGAAVALVPAGSFAAFTLGSVITPTLAPTLVVGVTFAGVYVARYRRELTERARIRRLFERYVSDDVVEELLRSPEALELGGQRREVTILFTDIRGFTGLSERLPAEQVMELLNAWLDRACRPVLDNGGHIDKFSGDGIMAVFGAPARHDDHADRAVRAAIGIAREVDAFREWLEGKVDPSLPPFDVGVGLHTGAPVVGNVGFERRTEYTVIGDPVNVAARIESLTRTVGCRILVSRAVVEATRQPLVLGPSHQLDVKGRLGKVDVIEIPYDLPGRS